MQEGNDQLTLYLLGEVVEVKLFQYVEADKYLTVLELLFEYGTSCLRREDFVTAAEWLQRCLNLIAERDDPFYTDIRLQTLQNLVRAHLSLEADDNLNIVAALLEQAAQDYPVASWLYLLKIDYLAKKWPGDAPRISSTLESMIRIVQLNESVVASITIKIHELHKLHSRRACQLLDLLIIRLIEADNIEWLEKTFVLRIWLAVNSSQPTSADALDDLIAFFHDVESRLQGAIGSKATSAVQLV